MPHADGDSPTVELLTAYDVPSYRAPGMARQSLAAKRRALVAWGGVQLRQYAIETLAKHCRFHRAKGIAASG
ncbi:MAG: hypothetical protein D6744_14380 [Planctomycetota bacterium]|nr:MAG: hypothetical protein D6744_14380 [Planctomycetota bacterium]